jgi:uncharacterized SAM-binding protein YcdF (DUF218 family)
MTWVFAALAWVWMAKSLKQAQKRLLLAAALLYLSSCPLLVFPLLKLWELPNREITELKGQYDVCVVLTGMLYADVPLDRPYFQTAADRIISPLYLLKAGKIKHILISGGFPPHFNTVSEAERLKDLLTTAGVSDSLITLEPLSLNTHENAKFTAHILKQKFPKAKVLLVTSSFHLRRALGCFEAQGITADPFATDFKSLSTPVYSFMSLFPSEGTFQTFYVLVHEVVGYLTYRALGYAK